MLDSKIEKLSRRSQMILYEVKAESHDGQRKYRMLRVGRSDVNKIKLVSQVTGVPIDELGLRFEYSVMPVTEVDGYPVRLVKVRKKS